MSLRGIAGVAALWMFFGLAYINQWAAIGLVLVLALIALSIAVYLVSSGDMP